jgi:hypothetical protein
MCGAVNNAMVLGVRYVSSRFGFGCENRLPRVRYAGIFAYGREWRGPDWLVCEGSVIGLLLPRTQVHFS